MAFNEKLKFSWGHIIAFVALIAISYFNFLGLTYLTDGHFILTAIAMVVLDVVVLFFFIGAQYLKGTDRKFKKRIPFERTLVFMAPFVLAVSMYPACHFWTVFDNRTQIEEKFSDSVRTSEQLFSNYEEYAKDRIDRYKRRVAHGGGTAVRKNNKVEALTLQLMDDNFTTLRNSAMEWVNQAQDATVWNVFMIGNLNTIQEAITSWKDQLTSFSEKKMSDEGNVSVFDSDSASMEMIAGNFDSIRAAYHKKSFSVYAIILLIVSYFFMMFPYFVQRRNTKSIYHLFRNETGKSGITLDLEDDTSEKSGKVRRAGKADTVDDVDEAFSREFGEIGRSRTEAKKKDRKDKKENAEKTKEQGRGGYSKFSLNND